MEVLDPFGRHGGRRRVPGPTSGAHWKAGRWPRAARSEPGREPNRQTFWFGAELDPDGSQVWFRITSEAVRRMREGDAVARGERLVDALLAWLTPARRLGPEVNRFQVLVSDDGDTRLERYGGD